MEDFIRVYSQAMLATDCDKLISIWGDFTEPSDKDHLSFNTNDISLRNDSIVLLDVILDYDSPESISMKKKYYTLIKDLVVKATHSYTRDLGQENMNPLEITGFQAQKYKAAKSGGYHLFHYERHGRSVYKDSVRRQLVWMIYLNDVPEGEGETEFLYQGLRIQPKKGDLIIWPASFTHTHRGNPVYTTDKYIVTGWMLWPKMPI